MSGTGATTWVYDFGQGSKEQKDLLGGKGANLAEMTNLGLPVPPGFTITTDACRYFLAHRSTPPELADQVTEHLTALEKAMGKTLGDPADPLLVSVRSGAAASMPGMMETVLNVGLTDESRHGLAAQSGSERFAWDSYRRLVQMFGKTVLGIDGDLFERALEEVKREQGSDSDLDLDAGHLEDVVRRFQAIVTEHCGRDFPQDPREQLDLAINAVFDSWNSERAVIYRRRERIPADAGTAVNVVAMVFGNLGMDSGTGVAFTRDPGSGEQGVYGDYLQNAQGEDVVAGIRNTVPLTELEHIDADAYRQLRGVMARLEAHYRDLCDIEFTIERGKLWMLQTRVGKRTAAAAFRIATQLVDEGLIDTDEAVRRVTGDQLAQLMFPRFVSGGDATELTRGMNASPGAAVGRAVFSSETAVEWAGRGERVVLVRRETNPDDLAGMIAAEGVLTNRGGKTSHAAVVARGMGKTCVCGAEELDVDTAARRFTAPDGTVVSEGDVISIDGSTGRVWLGEVPVEPPSVVRYFEGAIDPDSEQADDLVRSVHRILTHADRVRRLGVRANADTAGDAARARRFGAHGIGLCRTEHMFLGDRRQLVETLILAEDDADRQAALAALAPLQKQDFLHIFAAMDGLPVTVRLLDPPLHEFLPDLTELSVRVAMAQARGEHDERAHRLLAAVHAMHEENPMLGLRGVRLGLVVPGLFAMQVRAIAEAAAERRRAGGDPRPEIMIPLVSAVQELEAIREETEEVLAQVCEEQGVELTAHIGTMIEVPRAVVTADEIATAADFFSFGTNDLTQMTWGFSRDDVEAAFFSAYLERGIFSVSPFETLDRAGVGALVRMAVEGGRSTRPDLKLGVCGEHGGDPDSVHFFHDVGLDYVSCSPFRVPVARLEAGRAALGAERAGS
ncbi:pyruvate, phosphate dikinase [Geodermatophilus sp. TF02-6]|uniref:pyruvate, phosphate dikinase n=1 Tax=Geodermatophilus sp. TF02-6 TaxID=2250575 RepID=UPI000DE8B43F|nr:pyruvate, phosphate dikinase [Geodermatophilus sp. TF02-6]RBY76102.1 pyruvate, phosphate dikinase [Geodermatophilus sp. TF02-6]